MNHSAGEMFWTISIPTALITYLVVWTYVMIEDYKKKKARKKEAMLDMIPCLCKHTRWMHWPNKQNSACHDFVLDYMCSCRAYQMDTLQYLVRKYEAKKKHG